MLVIPALSHVAPCRARCSIGTGGRARHAQISENESFLILKRRGRSSYCRYWMRSTPRRLRSPTTVPCRLGLRALPRQAPRCLLSQKGIPPLPASGPIPLTPRQPRQQVSASANPSARPNPSDAAPTAPTFSAHDGALRPQEDHQGEGRRARSFRGRRRPGHLRPRGEQQRPEGGAPRALHCLRQGG